MRSVPPEHARPAVSQVLGLDFRPVGAFPTMLLRDVVASVSRRVAVPCSLLRDEIPLPLETIPGREQLDADKMLGHLEVLSRTPGRILVGLTRRDMGSALFTFFFGRARLGGGTALVSLCRLSPTFHGAPEDPAATLRRAVLEVLHECGHAAGLPHCRDFACLMHVAHDVNAVDNRGTVYCPDCADRCALRLRG